MKIIITCDEDKLEDAIEVLKNELEPSYASWQNRYNKPGWGWFFFSKGGVRFFVRGIKGGLSVTQHK